MPVNAFREPETPFIGARSVSSVDEVREGVALFGAPHGTPYPSIDNRPHETAPDAIRNALQLEREWVDHWDFDFGGTLLNGGKLSVFDVGNLVTTSQDGAGNRRLIEATTRELLKRKARPFVIGGDDSVPIPYLSAFKESGPITILQVDAHIDWRDDRYGEKLGFSSTMRRASEMPHVERIVQVGIRAVGSARSGEVETARTWGARIVTSRDVQSSGVEAVLDLIPSGARCVIAMDCDALDAAIMPAVMAPNPGGLTYWQVVGLVAGVCRKAELAGFSVVEFVPAKDPSGIAALTVARILCNAIGGIAGGSAP